MMETPLTYPPDLVLTALLTAGRVVNSADSTGCSDDLTVVSLLEMEALESALEALYAWERQAFLARRETTVRELMEADICPEKPVDFNSQVSDN
jgi:hypothetical protein